MKRPKLEYGNLKMKKSKHLTLLTGIFLFSVLVTIATPLIARVNGFNLILATQGNVEIKRSGWRKYRRAYIGTLVNFSDKLRLRQGAKAKVICTNLSFWNLRSEGEFPVSSGCSTTGQAKLRHGRNIVPTRAGNDQTIPYLISPRNTSILTFKPTLRWNPVAGATSYQVEVSGYRLNWKTEVQQSQVVYSGEQPLKPGFRYWVNITASNGKSNANEEGRFRGFTVLSNADRQELNTDITTLQQLNDDAKTIALTHLYRSNNLNANAIDLLEGLVKKDSNNVAVFQLLGSIYQKVGLNLLAKERYLAGLKFAIAQNNLEAQADINRLLGEVNESLDELKDALQSYETALVNYRKLGDEVQVEELQQKIDDIKGRIKR